MAEGLAKNENIVAQEEGILVDGTGVEVNIRVGAIGLVG